MARTRALLVAVLLLTTVANCGAAVWWPLKWTAPVGAKSYVCERIHLGAHYPAKLYARPNSLTSSPTPALPGQPDSAWISVTEDFNYYRSGGQAIRLRSIGSNGAASPWSNLVLVAVVPQGKYLDLGGSEWKPSRSNPLKPSTQTVSFSRLPADTILYAAPLWPSMAGKGPIVSADSLCR